MSSRHWRDDIEQKLQDCSLVDDDSADLLTEDIVRNIREQWTSDKLVVTHDSSKTLGRERCDATFDPIRRTVTPVCFR